MLLKHIQTVNWLVYNRTVRHVWLHWCQRNTQAAVSFTTFVWGRDTQGRERDCTAALLNPDRKVMKLDLWLISSLTFWFSRLMWCQPVCHQLGGGERNECRRRQTMPFKFKSPPFTYHFFPLSKCWCNNSNRNVCSYVEFQSVQSSRIRT